MPYLSKTANSDYGLGTIEDFRAIQPIMNVFNTNADQTDKTIYISQASSSTPIATGTSTASITQPILARKYSAASILNYGTSARPTVLFNTTGQAITVVAPADGRRFVTTSFSVDTTGYICFIAKVSTAMTVTFKLNTTAGTNSRDFAFSSASFIADSNGYARFIAPLTVGTYTGVTVSDTGAFDANSIVGYDLIGSAAGVIDFTAFSTASNPEGFLGHQSTYLFDCIDEATMEETLTTADRKCGLITTGSSATEKSMMVTLKVRTLNPKNEAGARGEVLKIGSRRVPKVVNGEVGALNSLAVTAGALTITGLTASALMSVKVDGTVLDRVESLAYVTDTTYHYNEANGAFAFSTIYNGKFPTIIFNELTTVTFFENKNLKTGLVGPLVITRTSETGTTIVTTFPKAEITKVSPTQEDSEVSHTFEIKVYAIERGNDFLFYTQAYL